MSIIEIKNLGKKYNIAHQRGGYVALRDVLMNVLKSPFSFLKSKAKQVAGMETKEEFWALKDINLEVQRGEVVGIIGANGAGKSTLLKILSQITPPTTGEIKIHGRVGSLLEVGTGFHPELTGRENIFLNGAILGMTRNEMSKKFDAIVEFAGIDKFLDTPVKYYSSGMYVRLAFSVAAHLDPDILIIDEVLAVGDAEFQKKCLGKMDEITKKEGRTILFVSHNMVAIQQLCKKTIVLDKGIMEMFGDTNEIVSHYLYPSDGNRKKGEWANERKEFLNPWFIPENFRLTDEKREKVNFFVTKYSETYLEISGLVEEDNPLLTLGYAIYSESGELLYWSYQTDTKESAWPKISKGENILRSRLPTEILNEGVYRIELIASLHNQKWILQPNVSSPSITLEVRGNLSDSPYWNIRRPGSIAPIISWEKVL